jgi:hypothetical protein
VGMVNIDRKQMQNNIEKNVILDVPEVLVIFE